MKMNKKMLTLALTSTLVLGTAGSVLAAGASQASSLKTGKTFLDMDAITKVEVDYTEAAQIPMEGWYEKTFESGRSLKMYFPEYANARAYFTVVAAPAGIRDVQAWAKMMGYTDLMEERGEVLAILQADKTWKDLDSELAYVTEAMNFLKSGRNVNDQALFANYGTFYLTGFAGGAAPLEAWAAANPIWVAGQAYVGGRSAGRSYLDEVSKGTYDFRGSSMYEGEELKNADIPVPTWFINYSSFDYSVSYWKSVNDCKWMPKGSLLNRSYWQDANSDALATEYDNSYSTNGQGISKVQVTYSPVVNAKILGDFLYDYTRYNTSYAYSNALGQRLEYTGVRVAAQKEAQSAEYLTEDQKVAYDAPVTALTGVEYDGYYVLAREQAKGGNGTFESGILSYSDDNDDGAMDAREYVMYIPDSAKGKKAPVVIQMPGGGQSSAVGLDCNQWWRIADEEGVVVIVLNEAYNNGTVALTWKNSDMAYRAITDLLAKEIDGVDVDIDWTRIYASGHSQGSLQSHLLATQHPEFYAAVGTTSGIGGDGTGVEELIPAMMISGEFDLGDMVPNLFEGQDKFKNWAKYLIKSNLCLGDLEGGYEMDTVGRTNIYSWSNEQGIELFKWGQTQLREHNAVPADIPKLWDFVSKFSKEADGTRYYSESGFKADDAVEIEQKEEALEVVSLDGQPAPGYDYSDANQLPMTGMFSKTLSYTDNAGNEASRVVYAYISEDASCRPYFYVLGVPEGTDVAKFVEESGWKAIADERGECLFVVTANGTAEEEMPFMTKAMSWLNTPKADAADPENAKNVNYWSAFGEWYFIGYGEAAAALEGWAAKNPIFVVSQAYVDGVSAGSEYLTAVGAETYPVGTNGYDITEDTKNRLGEENMIKRGQVPVPTLFAGAADAASVDYWKAASAVAAEGAADEVYGTVYTQAGDTWMTQYAGNISKVAAAGEVSTEEIFDFLTYYTRYDNTSAYGNALMRRTDYADVIVAAHQSKDMYAEKKITTPDGQTGTMICTITEIKGELREILFYMPDSAAELQPAGAPMITVWAGGSQTNIIFFDSTCWWETANKNGFGIILANEAYNTSVAVTPKECDACYKTMLGMLKEWDAEGKFDIDFTRVYSTGQSMGSMESQQFAQETPEYYAAVASTSFYQDYPETQSGNPIPTYLVNGEGNGKDDTGTMWDDRWNRADQWAMYFLPVNGFEYQNPEYDAEGNMTKLGVPVSEAAFSVSGAYDRFETYTWSDENGAPIMQYTNSLYRPHNCLTTEIPMLWDFLEHYRREADGTRVYSASAFKADDAVEILAPKKIVEIDENGYYHCGTKTVEGKTVLDLPVNFDDLTIPAFDNMRSNDLPFVGYYEQTVAVGEETRTMKVFIPEGTIAGQYSVMLTVPEGYETTEYLEAFGWIEEAEKEGFSVIALEPAAGESWGTSEEEYDYVAAAFAAMKSDKFFKVFSAYNFVGYGEAGAALQKLAMNNPIVMVGGVFIDASNIDASYMEEVGSTIYVNKYHNGTPKETTLTYGDTPVPVWIMESEMDETAKGVINYWLTANDCGEEFVADHVSKTVTYDQKAENIFTPLGAVSQVIVGKNNTEKLGKDLAATLYENFLNMYTRYNTAAEASTLAYRVDFDELVADGNLKFYEEEIDGYLRRWLVYAPDSVLNAKEGEKFPVIFSLPGSGSTYLTQFDNMRWHELADEKDFIVVMGTATMTVTAITPDGNSQSKIPRGTWNNNGDPTRVDDVAYIEYIASKVDEEYPTDVTRRYITGQSNGAVMSSYLSMKTPETFAAMAATSGGLITDATYEEENTNEKIPTYMLFGEFDLWTVTFPFIEESKDYQVRKLVEYWVNHNQVGDVDAPTKAEVVTTSERSVYSYEDNLYTYKTWTWEDAKNIPWVQYTMTMGRGHSVELDENIQMYNWLMQWTQDEEGNRYFNGELAE